MIAEAWKKYPTEDAWLRRIRPLHCSISTAGACSAFPSLATLKHFCDSHSHHEKPGWSSSNKPNPSEKAQVRLPKFIALQTTFGRLGTRADQRRPRAMPFKLQNCNHLVRALTASSAYSLFHRKRARIVGAPEPENGDDVRAKRKKPTATLHNLDIVGNSCCKSRTCPYQHAMGCSPCSSFDARTSSAQQRFFN